MHPLAQRRFRRVEIAGDGPDALAFVEHQPDSLGFEVVINRRRGRRLLFGSLPSWTSYPPFGKCPRNRIKPSRLISGNTQANIGDPAGTYYTWDEGGSYLASLCGQREQGALARIGDWFSPTLHAQNSWRGIPCTDTWRIGKEILRDAWEWAFTAAAGVVLPCYRFVLGYPACLGGTFLGTFQERVNYTF